MTLESLDTVLDQAAPPQFHYLDLKHAALCVDCDAVFDNRCGGCPACGSMAVGLIQRFLNPL